MSARSAITIVLASGPAFVVAEAAAGEDLRLPAGTSAQPALPADSDRLIPWSIAGFSQAQTESPAYGPDHLAVGPAGVWAVWDPVHTSVLTGDALSAVAIALSQADSLAFTGNGDLIVLNEQARTLDRLHAGQRTASLPMDRLCPTGVRLVVVDDVASGLDAFGNLHPLAELTPTGLTPAAGVGGHLVAPEHVVSVRAGTVAVDGTPIIAPTDALAARVVGEWVVLEAGERGAVRVRQGVSLQTGRVVELPLGGRYRPASGVGAAEDGSLAWLDPRDDGLHIVRAYP